MACQCHVADEEKFFFCIKNEEQSNSTCKTCTSDTWDLFMLNVKICNGLITCLYFVTCSFRQIWAHKQYAEAFCGLLMLMKQKKKKKYDLEHIENKHTRIEFEWAFLEKAVDKGECEDKSLKCTMLFVVGHLRVTNYVVNVLNEHYKYDFLIDTNHKM